MGAWECDLVDVQALSNITIGSIIFKCYRNLFKVPTRRASDIDDGIRCSISFSIKT